MGEPRIVIDALDSARMEALIEDNMGPVEAVPTPFPTWNAVCREEGGRKGLALGWYVVLGGATGKGKTTIALNLLGNAVKQGHSVGMVNFEMSQKQLASRYLSIVTGVDKRDTEPGGHFDPVKTREVSKELDRMGGYLYTNREPIISLGELRDCLVKMEEQGCRMIVVDYLQLIYVDGATDDYQQTKIVSNLLRQAVHQSGNYVGIALSQLNTEAGKSTNPPTEYNLHGGGRWAYDADQVVLLDHTAHRMHETNPYAGFGRMIVRKNRHGPPGDFPFRWDWKTLRATELAEDREPEVNGPKVGAGADEPRPF